MTPLAALRCATAPEHERLERRIDIPRRCRSAGEYRALLESFWGLYGELEPRLAAARASCGVLPGWTREESLRWLADDLDDLGCDERERRWLPRCCDLPSLDTPGQVWGALYVVEGAALGGGVIAAELQRAGGGLPSRFFTGSGGERGRRWHRFRAGLADWLSGPGRQAEVEASARAVFTVFERWCVPSPSAVGPAAGQLSAGSGSAGSGVR